MQFVILILITFLRISQSFSAYKYSRTIGHPKIAMASDSTLTLYGSQQTRSPLVDWYLLECKIPYQKKAPVRNSGHPFGQVPFLTDDTASGRVEVFESG